MSTTPDLCVVGAGSGGFGAACAAARLGLRVVLVEASRGLGGTSTWAGVNNYEPVAGATGLPWEVYDRLVARPLAVSLQCLRARYHPERPWGWYDCAEETDYRLSLSRPSGLPITFEPTALEEVMREMLDETKADRDEWKEQAKRVTLLVEDHNAKPKGFWARLRG